MSPSKEPRFFSLGEDPSPPKYAKLWKNWPRPVRYPTLESYQALFEDVNGETAIGEASTTNIYERACRRIQQYLPDGKFICLLRQPIDRSYSNFMHCRRSFYEPETDFLKAYRLSDERARAHWPAFLSYSLYSAYVFRLQDWFSRFRRAQFSIHLFDDLVSDTIPTLQNVFRFLGVNDTFVPDISIRHNPMHLRQSRLFYNFYTGPGILKSLLSPFITSAMKKRIGRAFRALNQKEAPKLDPDIKWMLTKQLRHEILKLQDLINRDLSHWLDDTIGPVKETVAARSEA